MVSTGSIGFALVRLVVSGVRVACRRVQSGTRDFTRARKKGRQFHSNRVMQREATARADVDLAPASTVGTWCDSAHI